jgi:RNA polymerase sigma-70 factor, ECF subfamily
MNADDGFAERYRRHYGRIAGLCRYLLGSAEQAEDAAQEVFFRALRGLDGHDPGLPFDAWLTGIASNYCIDLLRRRRTEARLFGNADDDALDVEADGSNPLDTVLEEEGAAALRGAVARLPDRYRIPLALAYFADFDHDAIAAGLGITPTHVATLLYRARQKLRAALAAGPIDGVS